MSRDPFEHMRNSNPVEPGQAPSPPMARAERIMGARAGVPGWVVSLATAALVVVVGGGTILLIGSDDDGGVAAGDTTSTAIASTVPESTVPESTVRSADRSTTSVTAATADLDVPTAVYFLMEATGESWGGGPFLVPVARRVDEPDPLTGTVQALIEGPTPDEASSIPAVSTAVPPGTELLGVTIDEGIATVDLSSEFAAGGGSFAEIARLDQLVYTVTRLDGVGGLRLKIDGELIELFGGHGIDVSDPLARTDIDLTLPAILIESPVYGDFGSSNPLVVSGTANVFEATVSLALTDNDGLILWEGFTTATCGTGCRGEWEASIPYDIDEPQMGSLIAWEASARDGSQTNVREHPVWLTPGQ